MLLDERSLILVLLLIDLGLSLGQICISLLLFPRVINLKLSFEGVLVSLLVAVGDLFLTQLVEGFSLLVLLHDTVEVVHGSLLFSSTVTEPQLLQVIHSLVVCFGPISLYILPVLCPLLGVLQVALDIVQ